MDLSNNNPLTMVDFIDEQSTREIVTIRTAEKLMAGKRYKISMDFVSILNDELRGFYRSSYMENGVREYVSNVNQIGWSRAYLNFFCFPYVCSGGWL
jgi:aminopeptidase N